jgi:Family of unknown function (DUF6082)
VATAVLLLVSPLLLLIPKALLDANWQELTDIGQSYTGVATLLSAAALVGVVISIRFQVEQTQLLRRQVARDMQFGLLRMAMADPHYAAVFHTDSVPSIQGHDDFRKAIFRTQWLRYLEFAFFSGELSDAELQLSLEDDFFGNADNRLWWTEVRQYWTARASEKPILHKRYIDILDQACRNRAVPAEG